MSMDSRGGHLTAVKENGRSGPGPVFWFVLIILILFFIPMFVSLFAR